MHWLDGRQESFHIIGYPALIFFYSHFALLLRDSLQLIPRLVVKVNPMQSTQKGMSNEKTDSLYRDAGAGGIVIVVLAFGVLPIPGIQAIAEVSHPNDIFAEIYRDASPSVVAISVVTEAGGGNGSGFVIDRAGHIVTNAHVVDEAEEIAVEFFEGGIYRARPVGLDLASDIAVVKVDGAGEPAESDSLRRF